MPKHDIIIIGADPWEHFTWRRRHHVAWNLAKDNRVLLVEPPFTVFQPFNEIQLNWRHLLNLGRFKHQGRNLYTYSPVRLFPISLPGAKRFNYYEIDKKRTFTILKKIVKKLGFSDPILWIYYCIWQYDYYDLFNEKIIITDIYDMYSSHTGNEKEQDLQLSIKKKEKTIINNSDIIFTVSEQLKNCIKSTNKTIHIIHHGVDYNFFQIKKNNEHSIKRNVETINRPILGYIGSMFSKIDFALLNYTAVCKPNWSILLIGSWWLKNEKDIELFDELINKDNVHYLGEKPKEQLPAYLSRMDVCLMPFKKIEFVKYMAPLKLLEYLAAGKPIVAIDREIKYDFSEFIKVASTKKDFVAAIGEALEEERQNDKSLVEARKNIARENSWESRIDQMMKIIELHLDNRNYISNPNSPF